MSQQLGLRDRRGKGEGGRGEGNALFSCAREAERNMGIKPRPSTGSGTRFRMLRLGRSASSVTVFPLLPTLLPPCLHSDRVNAIAHKAIEVYGRIDTWVQCAAVALYATFEQTMPEEFKRVIDVNLMGQV